MQSTQQAHRAELTLCHHCGAQCDDTLVVAEGHAFCCSGCSIVHQLMKTDEVCDVVNNESVATSRFTRKPIPRLEVFDDPAIVQSLVDFRDSRTTHCTMSLPSIHCASCIWTLENLFRIDPAILRSEVNFLKKTVRVRFVHDEISYRQVVELLTRLGYEPDIRLSNEGTEHPAHTSALRSLYYKIGVAGFAFGNVMLFSAPDYLARISSDGALVSPAFTKLFAVLSIALSLPVLLFSASDYFRNSIHALRERKLSLDVPVAMGISALFVRSIQEIVTSTGTGYLDSFTGLVFFLLIARLFQAKSFGALSFERTYKSFFPLSVSVRQGSQIRVVPLSRLSEGDIIVVRNAELVPADSVLLSDHAHIDYSFVSGESDVSELLRGATLYAGGKVVGSTIECAVVKNVSHSYLTELWNNSIFTREKSTSLIELSNTFARYFTLIVLVISAATFVAWLPNLHMALSTFTAVLIVACPCALTLAAPFTFGAAMTMMSRLQLYIRNVGVVTDFASIDTIVFDKTGTLTDTGTSTVEFVGTELQPIEQRLVMEAVRQSHHPLSQRILASLSHHQPIPDRATTSEFREFPGSGVECRAFGHHLLLGSADLVFRGTNSSNVRSERKSDEAATVVRISIDGEYRGAFLVKHQLRRGMDTLLKSLSQTHTLYLLSGDNDKQSSDFSPYFDHQHQIFHQKPEEKLRFIQSLQSQGRRVAMIGDGINDAGALRQSNLGIAVSENTTSFSPASDAIMHASMLQHLGTFIRFSRYSVNVLKAAFWVSVVYNIVGLALACTGALSPMFAAVFMPLSSWSVVGIAYGLMKLHESSLMHECSDPSSSLILTKE